MRILVLVFVLLASVTLTAPPGPRAPAETLLDRAILKASTKNCLASL
jgi:hypothetical protein